MKQKFDVYISGSGIIGMTAALQLAQLPMNVALACEATTHRDTPDVRAYALSARSRQLIEEIRCWPNQQHATPVQHMDVMGDAHGRVSFDCSTERLEALNWIVDIAELENRLREALHFQGRIQRVDAPVKAQITLICEGQSSATAHEYNLAWSTRNYQQWALATRVRSKQPHYQKARQWLGPEGILGLLPLGDEQSCDWAMVWSLPPALAQDRKLCAENDFCTALASASRNTVGSFELIANRTVWPLQHGMAPRWWACNGDNTGVLMGDSAHCVHPLAGQGLNLGLGDISTLLRILKERDLWRTITDPRLLRAYERERKAEFALIGGAGDILQRLFSARSMTAQYIRNCGMQCFDQSSIMKHFSIKWAIGA
jgi:2-polyprenyl-6-methoxyphenol hydroxylase-like FAD-dependent oxidoreductase